MAGGPPLKSDRRRPVLLSALSAAAVAALFILDCQAIVRFKDPECGNGIQEGSEECDSVDFGESSCEAMGFHGGTMVCTQNCTIDLDRSCFSCNDGACEFHKGEDAQNCQPDCGWVGLSAGGAHTCGVKQDGSTFCWGSGGFGQLGDPSNPGNPVARPVSNLSPAENVAVGGAHSCALPRDFHPRCWGSNERGQLGDGSGQNQWSSVPVVDVPIMMFIDGGYDNTCGVDQSGGAWCWGDNSYGQLGHGADPLDDCGGQSCSLEPVQVLNLTGVDRVAVGLSHACALDQTKRLWCWGSNSHGQLGYDPGGNTSDVPQQATTRSDYDVVACGGQFTCGLAGGTVWCWGDNSSGQLGDPNYIQDRSDQPVRVGLTLGASAVSAGWNYACAVADNRTVWCWGANTYGQIGTGQTGAMERTPQMVQNLQDAIWITSGGDHACVLRDGSTAWCWGRNEWGQLGDGQNYPSSTVPVMVVRPEPHMP